VRAIEIMEALERANILCIEVLPKVISQSNIDVLIPEIYPFHY